MPHRRDEYDVKKRTVKSNSGDDITITKNVKPIGKVNTLIQKMLQSVQSVPISQDLKNQDSLDDFNSRINEILDRETERFVSSDSGANGRDLAHFFNSLMSTSPNGIAGNVRGMLQNKSINELLNDQNSQINIVLSERYKNINSMYEDLRMVTEQLSELAEVIDTMRDSIVNSDNLISDISRQISFGDSDDTDRSSKDVESIRSMENSTGIRDKLKKIIIPETLKYGNFFVFTQPYNDLFAKFKAMDDRFRAQGVGGGIRSSVRIGESWAPVEEVTSELKSFYESYKPQIDEVFKLDTKSKKYTFEQFNSAINEYFKNIEVINDEMIPLLEDSDISALASPKMRESVEKAISKKKKDKTWTPVTKSDSKFSEAILNTSGNLQKAQEKYLNEFKEINGVFMKLYDPRRVVPVYVMDYCIGYYVLYETMQHTTTNVLNAVHTLSRTSMMFQTDRRKEFENRLVAVISDRICRSIDKPFLHKNSQFKELIANAIAFDDFYKKSFRVQFVPSNYMTHFKVNEDYSTHMGESVLKRSLFYAMLYLTLLLFKIIMITTRSSDTRMFLIHTSAEDQDISGRINKVVSDFKENQISYNDFGSVRGVLSKVGKGRDIGVPVGPGGERAFEVEVMEGQRYDLDTPLMEMLRKAMISNTGCPSAMLNYLDEVDYARQITMLHSKYTARVVTWQEETEVIISELYRKLCSYGGYEISEEKLDSLEFKWARPKSLNMTNLNDLISNSEQLAEFMIKVFEGDNSQADPRIKDRYFRYIVMNVLMTGVFDWEKIGTELKAIKLDLHADLKEEDMAKSES